MTELVLDNSVMLAWCFDEPLPPQVESVLNNLDQHVLFAPPLLRWEFANGLLTAQRRGRITLDQITAIAAEIAQFPIVFDTQWELVPLGDLLEIAARHKLTSYDAAYLEIALRLKLPLLTLDNALVHAAASENVKVLR